MFLDNAYTLIFGGCCSNVFALEAIVKHEADSGLLLTVVQFAMVVVTTLPSQLEPVSMTTQPSPGSTRLRFKRPQLPIARVAMMSLMFFAVNMLNNWAFAFDISVPLHIILRSFGSVTTLCMGWLYGRSYSRVQVGSVLFLTVGVVVSAWADASAKGKATTLSLAGARPASNFLPGLAVLFLAQLVSAYMGVYTEATYAAHGRHWRETLFYSHAFGLLFSAALAPALLAQARKLARAAPGPARLPLPAAARAWLPAVPLAPALVLLNALTQVACIRGVNRLSAQTGAVTVTVVLNVRKLASFLLSCVLFGNRLGGLMIVGSAIVFASGAVYGWDSGRRKKPTGSASNGLLDWRGERRKTL